MFNFPAIRPLLVSVLAIALGLSLAPAASANPWEGVRTWETARVERVVDGDTVIVRDAVTDARSRIRVLGINSPEKPTKKRGGWCGGWQAMDVLTEMLPEGTMVRLLSADQSSKGKGRPQRVILAYNESTGNYDLDVAWAMAERGWGHWFTRRQEANMSSLYRAAIEGAQSRRVGIWDPNLCGEVEQPGAVLDLRISRAPGSSTLNDEWVEIRNSGPITVDLSGWTLRDAGNQAWYTLPPGSVLVPGDYRVVHTGKGTDGSPTGHELYRGHTKQLYPEPGREPNLIGDGAYLLDRFGNYRFWREYPCTERCEPDVATNAIIISEAALGRGKGKKRVSTQYVKLLNQGPTIVCLDGYQLRGQALKYTIPTGTCVAPGATWMLHGGQGSDSVDRRYLNRKKKPVLYLSDSIELVSDREQVVTTRQW
jgi:endonuclease YncB( thermonuclease family)